jgi:hypothetical protein
VRLRESHSEGGGEGDPEATPRGDQRGGSGDERAEATRREREAAAACECGPATGARVRQAGGKEQGVGEMRLRQDHGRGPREGETEAPVNPGGRSTRLCDALVDTAIIVPRGNDAVGAAPSQLIGCAVGAASS